MIIHLIITKLPKAYYQACDYYVIASLIICKRQEFTK